MSRLIKAIGGEALKGKEKESFLPEAILKCPSDPINVGFEPAVNPAKLVSRLFLIYSTINIGNFYELTLKGERILRKMGRRLQNRDLPIIISHIKREDEIISLDLSNNEITDEGFEVLSEFLSRSTLVNLNLRNNDIHKLSEHACELIAKSGLKRLTLSGNHLSLESADNLKLMLRGNLSLEVLDLAAVNFYVHSINRMFDVLLEHSNNLKVLNISRLLCIPRYRLRSYYLTDIIHMLLVGNNTLEELHLENNGITDHDVERIVQGLTLNRSLLLLNLTANQISNIGLEQIAAILPESPLKVLLLRSNTIGNYGAIALSKTMPLSRILHLDLAHNRIDDIGLANLLWTIKKPVPLYTFYIFGNHFTKQTLEIIHMQMLRGKLMPDSLDIVIYWRDDGVLKCSYNPVADEYRKQMAGVYDGGFVASKPNILPYPIIDVLHPHKSLERLIGYPKGYNPKIVSHYKDHIAVK